VASPLGRPRLHLRLTDSTNLRARELATRGAPYGTLVTADAQSAGRGRQGRAWSAPAGSALLGSLVLSDPPTLLPLRAGVAVAEICEAVMADVGRDGSLRIKWPNDVLVDGRKVAGILVEGRPVERWAVLGIGLNVAVDVATLPSELQDRAGTLGLRPSDREGVLSRLLRSLERWLATPDSEVLDAVRGLDALRGQQVTWADGEGIGAGIAPDGRLLVRGADQLVALDAGEVHLGPSR
jgi:BirA family transcriptional regulator, biotin operon repressor / biotin---[acetyl-CoA-carboxylase] ligase